MDEKTIILRAYAKKNSIIKWPALHVVIKKRKDILIGHCLDFNTFAYSQEKNISKAMKSVVGDLSAMAIFRVLNLLHKKDIDNLYKNSVPFQGGWVDYMNASRKTRIKEIKSSYENFSKFKEEVYKELKKEVYKELEKNIYITQVDNAA